MLDSTIEEDKSIPAMILPRTPLILIHDPRDLWRRQMTARLPGLSVSTNVPASEELSGPIALIDGTDDPCPAFEVVSRWRADWPDALILVLLPRTRPELGVWARELGADLALPGPTPPPLVADLLRRWANLVLQRP
jgi:hypothetical protein